MAFILGEFWNGVVGFGKCGGGSSRVCSEGGLGSCLGGLEVGF